MGASSLLSLNTFAFDYDLDIYLTLNFPTPLLPYPAPILIELEVLKIFAINVEKKLFFEFKFCAIKPKKATTNIKRD